MPVARHTQTSLASGEFDPLLWSREDVSFFYNSARLLENVVALPQGGAKRREGWSYRGMQRGSVSRIVLSDKVVTAPNGGNAANAKDGNDGTFLTTTTPIGTTAVYEVVRLDLAAPTAIGVIDLRGVGMIGLPTPGQEVTVAAQYSSNGTAWTTAVTMGVSDIQYNRRFAHPPNTPMGTARYWRLVVLNSGDLGGATITTAGFRPWYEFSHKLGNTSPGNFSVHRLTTSVDNEYVIWLTADCADIYRADTGEWVTALYMPYTNGQVQHVKSSPNLDTIIFFHEDVRPFQIQRLGSDINWTSSQVDFDSVVEFPFGDRDVAGGENEIQFYNFSNMAINDKLRFEYNGAISDSMTWTGTQAQLATAIKTAIETIVDITSVTVTSQGDDDFKVEFTGVDGKTPWPILVVDIYKGSGTVTVSREQFGREDFDLLWSESRGFPSCGAFYQGRQWMGGFKARRDLLVASRSGSLFEFKEDADPVAGSPIVVAPNVDDQITIMNIYPGRHLQIFTSSAEMYVPNEPITIDNMALKITTRHGASQLTQPVDIQGGTLFSDRNGRALREYLFQDAEQSYSAEPVSLLAGHLMATPRSMVLRRGRDIDEPTLLLLANTGLDRSGNEVPAAMVVIDRAQQVTGFMRVNTAGKPLAFAASQSGEAFAVTRRDLAGAAWNYLEQFDEKCMSDAGVRIAGAGSTVDLNGVADHLEGQTVFVHGDGLPLGEFPVVGGIVDLGDETYSQEVEVGLKMLPRIILHPYKGRGESSPTMTRQRIFRALLQLERTAGVAVGINGGKVRPLALRNIDSGNLDPTLDELLFSGAKRVSGFSGWALEPVLEITQVEPMPFLLRSLSYDVRF